MIFLNFACFYMFLYDFTHFNIIYNDFICFCMTFLRFPFFLHDQGLNCSMWACSFNLGHRFFANTKNRKIGDFRAVFCPLMMRLFWQKCGFGSEMDIWTVMWLGFGKDLIEKFLCLLVLRMRYLHKEVASENYENY